jgi:hypothetical protein
MTVVAPATTWRHDQVVLYVMYLCHKMMTMYCCEDYMDCCCDLCLELKLSLFCCLHLLHVPCFGGSPSGEAAKTVVIYINIFLS